MSVTLVDPGQVGLVDQVVGLDRWIGVGGSSGTTYIDTFYTLTDNPAGGGPTVIEITNSDRSLIATTTIADGELAKQTTISLAIGAGEQVLRRVTQAPPAALNLSGYVSSLVITGGGGPSPVGGDLCLLVDVKANLNITVNDFDAILARLISGVSQAAQSYMRRIVSAASYSERFYPSPRSSVIVLPQWPVDPDPANLVVTEDLVSLDTSSDVRLEGTRRLVRTNGGYPTHWGRMVTVTWNAGHASMPQDIQMAACDQVAHEFNLQKASGQGWLGQTSKTTNVAGTESFLTGPWLPHVQGVWNSYRAMF